MSNGQAPAPYGIGPPAPTPQQAPAPYHPQTPPQHYTHAPSPTKGPAIGSCAACEGAIYEGDEVNEMFPGVARVSRQTGQMLAEGYPGEPPKSFTVHRKCSMELIGDIYPDDADEMLYEMSSEMANEQMDEFLSDRGLDFDALCNLLDKMGYKSHSEELDERVSRSD